MSNKSLSNSNMRNAIIACTTVVMLVAVTFGVNEVQAANPLTLDITIADDSYVMEGSSILATITVTNGDSRHEEMEVKMFADWLAGSWAELTFYDDSMVELEDDTLIIPKEEPRTVYLKIECIGACEAGDQGTLRIYALSDPVFRKGGSPGTCGSSDCINDDTPPTSGNATQVQSFTITAKTGYQHTLECDDGHAGDTNIMFQSETYYWGYDMENSGWETDQYTFDMTVTNEANVEQNFWTLVPGFSTLQITGTSDSSVNAVYTQEGTMTIEPSSTARPGTYTVGLLAESVESGNQESCTFSVIIPQPDLEILDTDITFSQSSAWINSRQESQRVIISATVRNNGGTVDLDGNKVEDVEVIFLIDGSQFGELMVISSLGPNGAETTSPLTMKWNPGRAHDGDEVGIPIKVSVDPSAKITESENDNNIGSQYFKVVKTKASNPSFYMSFLSLVGAVGAAVLLSTYYRNKDSEE